MSIVDQIKKNICGHDRSAIVKKNIVASLGVRCVSIAVSFALVPMTIGYVSSELYGIWLALSSILTWLCFLDIGFSQGLKNKLTEAIAVGDWVKGKSLVSTTYFMMILIFVPMCLIIGTLIPFINWCNLLNIDIKYQCDIIQTMRVLIAFASMQMIVNVLVSVVAAFQKVALSNSFSVIGNAISLVVIFILTKTCPPSILALAFTFAAMPVAVTVIASLILYFGKFRTIAPSITSVKLSNVKELFGLGYKFFIINIQVVVLYQSTNVLISNVSSPNEVTYYNVAYKLLNVAMMVYTIITGPLWPAYTDAYARGDFDWMKNVRKKMQRVLFCSIAFCCFITLLSPLIYRIWLGDEVDVPFVMTMMVALYVSIYCWMNLNGTLIVGMGKITVETVLVLVGMISHIPVSLFLGSFIGAYGVIVSMIMINVLYAVVMQIQVNKILNKTAKGIWLK